MNQFSEILTEDLIRALIERKSELFLKEKPGLLTKTAFELRRMLGAVACVNGILYRFNEKGQVELMALRRSGGAFPGKLCLVGGTIAKGESWQDTLTRHFRDDLGIEIGEAKMLLSMSQYHEGEADEQWMQDPAKEHNVAPVYLVQTWDEFFTFRCQSDSALWFTERLMPPDEEFGYTNERLYRKAFLFFNRRL